MAAQQIRGLDEFVEANGLLNSDPTEKLRGLKLGVDGLRWLLSLKINEPYQVAMGGMYLSLRPRIAKALVDFEEAGIRPLFVFSGLQLARTTRPNPENRSFTDACVKGWQLEHGGDRDQSKEAFNSQSTFTTEHINRVIQILQQLGAEVMRAPFCAQPQLVWMLQYNLVGAIYSSNLVLLWGPQRVITEFDLDAGKYGWIDRDSLLQRLKFDMKNYDMFVDTCLVAGAPPISFPLRGSNSLTFEAVAQALQQCQGVAGMIQQLNTTNGQIRDTQKCSAAMQLHNRASVTVRNHIVMTVKAGCVPLNWNRCPPDLNEVFGLRLPAEVFFFLTQGIVSPQLLNNVLSTYILEPAPLADSDAYREIVDKLMMMHRGPAINTLRSVLNNVFQTRKLIMGLWHGETREFPIQPGLPFLRFSFSRENLERAMAKHSTEVDPYLCLHWIEEEREPAAQPSFQPIQPNQELDQLARTESGDQVACFITLSVLFAHGYLAMDPVIAAPQPRLVLSHFGFAALEFGPEFMVEGMRVLSLVMMGRINGQPLDQTDQQTLIEVRFISRVFAFLPMRFNGLPWDDPVDHDLIRFNSIVNRMRLEWSHLAEMMLLHIACRRVTALPFSAHREIIRQVRGPGEQSCAMGVVAKYVLTNDPTPEINKNTLNTVFRACENPMADLTNACKFWAQVVTALTTLRERVDAFPQVLFEELQQADRFLSQRRQQWGF